MLHYQKSKQFLKYSWRSIFQVYFSLSILRRWLLQSRFSNIWIIRNSSKFLLLDTIVLKKFHTLESLLKCKKNSKCTLKKRVCLYLYFFLYLLSKWFSKCVPLISSISTTGKVLKMEILGPHLGSTESEILEVEA